MRLAHTICLILLMAVGLSRAATAEGTSDIEQLYIVECGRCHGPVAMDRVGDSIGKPRFLQAMMPVFGPNLIDIVGRPAGIIDSFAYSEAFRAATEGLVWTEENLERLMIDSRAMIPGSFMFYAQPDPLVRRALMDYLKAPAGT